MNATWILCWIQGLATVLCLTGCGASSRSESGGHAAENEAAKAFFPDERVWELLTLVAQAKSAEIDDETAEILVTQLREEYPYVSLRPAMATLLPRNQRRISQPLFTDAEKEVYEYERDGFRGARTEAQYYRAESLKLLHKESVRTFLERDGNGFLRTPPPSAIHLPMDVMDGLTFDHAAQDGPFVAGEPIQLELDSNPPRLGTNFLRKIHQRTHDDFLQPIRFGHAKSVDQVAGFVAHHIARRPQTEPWDRRRQELPFSVEMTEEQQARYDQVTSDSMSEDSKARLNIPGEEFPINNYSVLLLIITGTLLFVGGGCRFADPLPGELILPLLPESKIVKSPPEIGRFPNEIEVTFSSSDVQPVFMPRLGASATTGYIRPYEVYIRSRVPVKVIQWGIVIRTHRAGNQHYKLSLEDFERAFESNGMLQSNESHSCVMGGQYGPLVGGESALWYFIGQLENGGRVEGSSEVFGAKLPEQ